MKEVMSEYGRAIIAAISTILLVSLLFISKIFNGGNILEGTGRMAISMNNSSFEETQLADNSYFVTTETMDADSSDVISKEGLVADTDYSSDNLVSSKSGKNNYSVKVLSVSCVAGIDEGCDVTGEVLKSGVVRFSKKGIYKIRMRCTDKGGSYFYGNMYMTVSPKGGMAA